MKRLDAVTLKRRTQVCVSPHVKVYAVFLFATEMYWATAFKVAGI